MTTASPERSSLAKYALSVSVYRVAPTARTTLAASAQRLRPDAVTEADAREHFQENAPSVRGGLYLVPKVIE